MVDETGQISATVMRSLKLVQSVVLTSLPDVLSMRTRISWKIDGSPVTEADLFLERKIKEVVESELGAINFVGEESFSPGLPTLSRWTVVVDPIDGTENFISGSAVWGVSLSIWKDSRHLGSLLMLPELGDMLMTGDSVAKHNSRITGLSSSITDSMIPLVAGSGEVRITGCAVYNLFSVITGKFARFVNPVGARTWDLIAGLQLAMEHGCEVRVDERKYAGQYLEPAGKYRVEVLNQPHHHFR